jgi:hypothetical protein
MKRTARYESAFVCSKILIVGFAIFPFVHERSSAENLKWKRDDRNVALSRAQEWMKSKKNYNRKKKKIAECDCVCFCTQTDSQIDVHARG